MKKSLRFLLVGMWPGAVTILSFLALVAGGSLLLPAGGELHHFCLLYLGTFPMVFLVIFAILGFNLFSCQLNLALSMGSTRQEFLRATYVYFVLCALFALGVQGLAQLTAVYLSRTGIELVNDLPDSALLIMPVFWLVGFMVGGLFAFIQVRWKVLGIIFYLICMGVIGAAMSFLLLTDPELWGHLLQILVGIAAILIVVLPFLIHRSIRRATVR